MCFPQLLDSAGNGGGRAGYRRAACPWAALSPETAPCKPASLPVSWAQPHQPAPAKERTVFDTALPRFALKLPLITLDVSPRRIRGEYHAHNRGTCALHVRLPSRSAMIEATVNGRPVAVEPDLVGYVRLPLPDFDIGDHIAFDVFELRG